MSTTTDLADFDESDMKTLCDLLIAQTKQGYPKDFNRSGIHVMKNIHSYNIFFTNDEFECAMLNGKKLEMWHHCGNCGHEGFHEDCQLSDEGCNQCIEDEKNLEA